MHGRYACAMIGGDSNAVLPEQVLLSASLAHLTRCRMRHWGIHGVAHWWRVRHNGLLLASATGADETVVRLFALFHDSHRHDDHADPMHGPRAAQWLARLRDGMPAADGLDCPTTAAAVRALSDERFARLRLACELHTGTPHHDDPTIAACFAADRLDLWRVGLRPNPKYIPIARDILTDEFIAEAMRRTDEGLRWTDVAEFAGTWGVAIPERHR